MFGGGDPAAGLEALPPHKVGQGRGGRLVAAFGECPASLQYRDRSDGEPVEPSAQALADREDRQQFRVGGSAVFRSRAQLVDRYREAAVREGEGAGGHAYILLDHMFDSWPFVAGRRPIGEVSSRGRTTGRSTPSGGSLASFELLVSW